jgi:hypothetical protein
VNLVSESSCKLSKFQVQKVDPKFTAVKHMHRRTPKCLISLPLIKTDVSQIQLIVINPQLHVNFFFLHLVLHVVSKNSGKSLDASAHRDESNNIQKSLNGSSGI